MIIPAAECDRVFLYHAGQSFLNDVSNFFFRCFQLICAFLKCGGDGEGIGFKVIGRLRIYCHMLDVIQFRACHGSAFLQMQYKFPELSPVYSTMREIHTFSMLTWQQGSRLRYLYRVVWLGNGAYLGH